MYFVIYKMKDMFQLNDYVYQTSQLILQFLLKEQSSQPSSL